MTLMLANFVKFYKLGFNSWAVKKRTFVLFLPTPQQLKHQPGKRK